MADGVRRRTFVAGATAVALLSACGEDSEGSAGTNTAGGGTPDSEPNAFRLSSRHVKHPCQACLSHNRNRYYATAEDADADRPHDGCSCEVRGQLIAADDAANYFSGGRSMFDKRSA